MSLIETHTPASTLVAMPPKDQWDQFVEIKKNHMNPKIKRPPYPHMTLMQPFVGPDGFDEVAKKLEEGLKDFKPFKCTIKEFKLYENKKSQTLYLDPVCEPAGALNDLYDKLVEIYPDGKLKRGFDPHIGVGFFRDQKLAKELRDKYQKDWKPIEFTVKEIYINYRASEVDPFYPRRVIHLGGDELEPYNEPVEL